MRRRHFTASLKLIKDKKGTKLMQSNEEDSQPEEAPQSEIESVSKADGADELIDKKSKRKQFIIRWALTHVGILMMAISVYFFQTPNDITLGGVAGVALILTKVIPLSQSVIMFIINILLLIIGFIILGKSVILKTAYCSLFYTALIWLFETFDVLNLISGKPTLTDETFLELCYAILLFGVGGALLFNCGTSSGGTDIIALILKKYTKFNVGFALLLIELVVVGMTFFTFTIESALFSLLGLFAKSFIVDGVIESIGKTKYLTIITTCHEPISEFIIKEMKHSYTIYDAEGGYTGEKRKVLVTICRRSEAFKIKSFVKKTDPKSFVIITDANEILGKGFSSAL